MIVIRNNIRCMRSKSTPIKVKEEEKMEALTKWTKSLAAVARISVQETTPGHLFSTKVLALIIVSNPSVLRSLLSSASFSVNILLPGFVAIRIEYMRIRALHYNNDPFKILINHLLKLPRLEVHGSINANMCMHAELINGI